MTAVLLIGNLRSSLTLARQLARAGHEVHWGVDELDPFGHTSRAVKGWFVHAPIDVAPRRTLEQIDAYIDGHPKIRAIIPVSEIAARLISRHRDRFAGRARAIVPSEAVLETCIDKPRMFDLCDEVGLPVAPRRMPRDQVALFEDIQAIGFPCVVKPADAGHFLFDRKAIVVNDMDEARTALPYWPGEHSRLCVQKFVKGPRHILMFAAKAGRIFGAVDCKVLRTDLADGTGFTTQMVSAEVNPTVAIGLGRLIARLNYTGVGDVDIMVDDRTGEISFLELNPRLGASFKGAEICGLPLSRMILALGMDSRIPRCPDPWSHPIGRRLSWSKADLWALKRIVQRREWKAVLPQAWALTRSLLTFNHMTFDLLDPMPTVWSYGHSVLHRLGFGKAVREATERERERFSGYQAPVDQDAPSGIAHAA